MRRCRVNIEGTMQWGYSCWCLWEISGLKRSFDSQEEEETFPSIVSPRTWREGSLILLWMKRENSVFSDKRKRTFSFFSGFLSRVYNESQDWNLLLFHSVSFSSILFLSSCSSCIFPLSWDEEEGFVEFLWHLLSSFVFNFASLFLLSVSCPIGLDVIQLLFIFIFLTKKPSLRQPLLWFYSTSTWVWVIGVTWS